MARRSSRATTPWRAPARERWTAEDGAPMLAALAASGDADAVFAEARCGGPPGPLLAQEAQRFGSAGRSRASERSAASIPRLVGCCGDRAVASCGGGRVVISGERGARVFVHVGPCDMRKQMNGLSTLVRETLRGDPQGGDLYLFCNRRRDMIRILFFDRGGYCLLSKRLERGTFRITLAEDGTAVEISHSELASLLANAELVQKAARAA